MNKKSTKILFILITLIIIIVIGLTIYLLQLNSSTNSTNSLGSSKSNSSTNSINNQKEEITFDENAEKGSLNSQLQSLTEPLGWIALSSSFSSYNETGTLTVKPNVDLLESTETRQLFTLEYMIQNSTTYNDYIVLNVPSYTSSTTAKPTDDCTYAYYNYDQFSKVYKMFFNSNFDVTKRKISPADKSFEENHEYIYYENRHPGANELSVTELQPTSITYDETSDTYTAKVKMVYSRMAQSYTNKDFNTAELKYKKHTENKKDYISIVSFKIID